VANRKFTAEFRIGIARRIVSGESVTVIHEEHKIKRSVLYRWRDAYLKEGEAGLIHGKPGPRPGAARRAKLAAADEPPAPAGQEAEALERARQRIAELERTIGKQTLEISFLTGAFRRVKELRQNKRRSGETASTERSGS